MKYFILLVTGFMYMFTASALMVDPRQMTNTGDYVPYGCEVWNDGCNDCEKTESGYICPPKNCATMRTGYCREKETQTQKRINEEEQTQNRTIPANCTTWFDGCNSCGVENGRLTYCTERACNPEQLQEPYCSAYKKNTDRSTKSSEILEVQIGPELIDCSAFRRTCMVMDGKPFDGWIDGFDFEPGHYYELRIKKALREVPLLDVGPYKYTLLEIITKRPATDQQVEPILEPADPDLSADVPYNCLSWFDGCNTCTVRSGEIEACTRKFCSEKSKPYCMKLWESPDPSILSVPYSGFDNPQPSPSIPKPSQPDLSAPIPANCTTWFDGCNTCEVRNGELTVCTQRECMSVPGEAYCQSFKEDGAANNGVEPTPEDFYYDTEPKPSSTGNFTSEPGDSLVEPAVKKSFWSFIWYHLFGVGK